MNGLERRLVALCALLVGVAFALASPPAIALLAVGMPLVAFVVGPSLALDRVAQAALTTGALVVGVLAARLGFGDEPPGPDMLNDRTLLLGMPMLAAACARSIVARPVYGVPVSLAAVLVALTAAGRAPIGVVFPLVAVASLTLGFAALRASDDKRAPLSALRWVHWTGIGLAALVVLGATAGARAAVPRIRDYVMAQVAARWERQRSGFSDAMWLGALEGLLQSDAVVLRVRGPAPDLLRGGTLDRYGTGRWELDTEGVSEEVVETSAAPSELDGLVELEHARTPKRYFLPLGAGAITSSERVYAINRFGVARPIAGFESKRLWYRPNAGPPLAPPRPVDRQVPSRIASELAAIRAHWGIDAVDPSVAGAESVAMQALSDRLGRDYRYSTQFKQTSNLDPIVEFLTVRREGHCEYFASALALLARSAGIPARVVVGYRVVERSPFGYRIVRERNAHSWVEAWIDDKWVTFDPTPASDVALATDLETSTVGALTDALATGWEAVDDWLGRRTPFEFAGVLVGLVAVFSLYRALRSRSSSAAQISLEEPLPEFRDVVGALRSLGVERRAHEPIETLSDRARSARVVTAEVESELANAISAYASLRYGRAPDGNETTRALSAVAARLRSTRSRGP